MKTNTKRMVSVVLLLTLLVSLFSGLTLGASAAEPTSASEVSYKKNGNYIYNWGKRDTTATFLTTYAQAYYTGNYTYASLSAKTGTTSTSADAIYNSALGTALHNMLAAKQTSKTSYDGTRSLYRYTDCEQNADKISSFYSATLIGPSWDGGKTWNREHTWPNSKGLNGSDETDIMMLRPTSVSENSSRGNNAYGEGVGCYDPNELGQSLHGDVARLILQHLIRWGNTELCFGSTGVMESRAILLKWLAEDPVDTWEMGRNDAVQAITGVRNVFVDYPELAFQLLGASVPSNYPTPSKGDSTGGGDSGDPSATYTVKFSVPSGVTAPATQEVAYGASVNLKTPSGTPADSSKTYTFVGWVTAPYEDSETRPTYHTGSYAIKSNITFYALYSYASGSAASGYAKLTDSTVPNGDYVIVSDTTGMALGTTATNNWLIAGKTYTTGSSIATPNSADVWTITNGVISAKNGNGSIYSSAAKKIALSSTDSTVWSFTNNSGVWTISNSNVGQLSYNSSGGWRPYSGGYGSDKTFYLYRATSGGTATYYSTLASINCSHTHTTAVAAVAATCAAPGYTAGVYCNDCGQYISGHEVIPATGKHTFTEYAQNDADTHLAACSVCGDVVEEAHSFTASVSGDTTTYTCSKCGYSYTSTAARCTVSFSVPTGVSAVASIDSVGGASITLPTAGDVSGYTFCGWTTAAVDPESASKPTVLTGAYQPTADITLYALYSRTVSGSGSTGYAKFTGSSIKNGDYVIVSAATGSALTASAANNWLKAGSTYSGDSIASPDAADVWTVTDGVITAKNGSGSIYSSAAKKIALSSTDSTVWSFTNNGSDWTIANDTVGQLSYNSFGGWRPYSGGYGSDKTFVLYRAGAASTTYYTTNPTVSDGSLTDENLKFFGKTVIFEADFSIKYYVPKAVVDTYDSVYVSVTKSVYDADGNVTGKKTTKVDVTDYNSGYNAYGFKFAGIAAAEVGSNVDATVYGVKDGKTYEGATQSGYSVKQYCYNTLSKANTTAANKRVLVDFLNYASAAQVYFNINTKNLVNAELTDEQKAFGTATVAAIGNDRADGTVANATVAVSGCTLIFEGKIMMKFVFDPATYLKNGGSLSDLSVVVKDADGKVLKTFAAADFEDYGTRKSVVFDGLASTEMRKAVTFQVMVGDTAVSNSRTYSIQTYAYSKQNDAAQGTLVQEMIKYGDSMVTWKIG